MTEQLSSVAQTAESVDEKKDCGCGCNGSGGCKGHDDDGSDKHWLFIVIVIAIVGVLGFAFGWWTMLTKLVKKQIA